MKSPIILFESKLPRDVLNIIQTYLINDFAYQALKEYYNYLNYKKELYEDFAYQQYITPNCTCRRYYNSIAQRWKERECSGCFIFEYTNVYMPKDFRICIYNNSQYHKIQYGEKINYNSYNEDDDEEEENENRILDYQYA
jgi:hypothetical protein